jgi:hypothetical protein
LCTPPPAIANEISSVPAVAFASRIASRSDPLPLSLGHERWARVTRRR